MKKMICIMLCTVMVVLMFVPTFADAKEFKFSSDGTFKILHITDSQDDVYPAYDLQEFLRLAISTSKPDLIVFTGDLVEDSRIGDIANDAQGYREGVLVKDDHEKTLENLTKAADNVLSILQESGIPFALAQGNNDYKCGVSNKEWLDIFSKYSNCLVRDDSDDAGERIDYNLKIYGNDGSTKFNIWMLDTGKGGINADQIEWYKKASTALTNQNNGTPVPAFVFQHIHTCDVGNLFEECKPWDDGARAVGTKFYRLDQSIANGYNTFAYVPGQTSDEFKAWKTQGDVIGAFFGHQHVDGFSGVYDGIEIGFTYGCEFAKIGPYGYRLFTLHENDIKNYDNEVYRYNGTVRLGNQRIEAEENKTFDEYDNIAQRIFAYIWNFCVSIVSLIVDFFTSL